MSEDFDKERQELFNRFKESLRKSSDDYFFDEDDLIEIFDYAGDMSNDYIRAEVLMRAARFYPDSETLRQRRITFYSDVLDPSMMEGFVDDCADDHSLLTEIALLRSSAVSRDETRARMEEFLKNYPPFDDEETIRYVSLANSCGLLEWVYKNYSRILRHVQNEDVLLYELGYSFYDTFTSERNFDRAAELLGRLVEKMPFIADYWQMLARSQYYSKNHKAKYADSLDLALALDPAHRESLLFKAEIIAEENSVEDNIADLRHICDICHDQQQPLQLLLTALTDDQLKTEGVDRLEKFLETNPDSFFAISQLLEINPERAVLHFDEFENHARLTSSIGHVWSLVIYQLVYRRPDAVRRIIDYVIRSFTRRNETIEAEFYTAAIELLFYLQDFDIMFTLIEAYTKEYETSPAVMVIMALASAKLGLIVQARTYAMTIVRMNLAVLSEGPGWHAMSRFVNIGAIHLMQDLLDRTAPDVLAKFIPAAYNPFAIWSPDPTPPIPEL